MWHDCFDERTPPRTSARDASQSPNARTHARTHTCTHARTNRKRKSPRSHRSMRGDGFSAVGVHVLVGEQRRSVATCWHLCSGVGNLDRAAVTQPNTPTDAQLCKRRPCTRMHGCHTRQRPTTVTTFSVSRCVLLTCLRCGYHPP